MTYAELKAERQKRYDDLFKKIGLFWAFSNEQSEEGKKAHPLEEGQKYCSIGSGGYFPGQNKKAWNDGMTELRAWEKQANAELKESKLETEKAILYELNNHECFYTGEIDDVIDLFKGTYTIAQIKAVYKKFATQGAMA